ncbi:hypothetical protein DVA67_006065 [Solirubrobacter sp. CPCC 204708]|nr:hypothetical protein [Solirubrobacter deserti]
MQTAADQRRPPAGVHHPHAVLAAREPRVAGGALELAQHVDTRTGRVTTPAAPRCGAWRHCTAASPRAVTRVSKTEVEA